MLELTHCSIERKVGRGRCVLGGGEFVGKKGRGKGLVEKGAIISAKSDNSGRRRLWEQEGDDTRDVCPLFPPLLSHVSSLRPLPTPSPTVHTHSSRTSNTHSSPPRLPTRLSPWLTPLCCRVEGDQVGTGGKSAAARRPRQTIFHGAPPRGPSLLGGLSLLLEVGRTRKCLTL